MTEMVRAHWQIGSAILLGFIVLPIVQREYTEWDVAGHATEQRTRPVLIGEGRFVDIRDGAIIIGATPTKVRDCRALAINGYTLDRAGVRHSAYATRLDFNGPAVSRPLGKFNLGIWSIQPWNADTARVMLVVDHDCDGVIVQSIAAEVALP